MKNEADPEIQDLKKLPSYQEARKRLELGVKVGLMATHQSNFVNWRLEFLKNPSIEIPSARTSAI